MKKTELTLPELALIGGTRGLLGAGVALLLAGKLNRVDRKMRVAEVERMYAVGDSVSFDGPKMGHMAVLQAEVAAANVLAEIEGREPQVEYNHEVNYVIDEGGADSIYLHKGLWDSTSTEFRHGRFWSWAKRLHEKYWLQQHD